MSLKEVLDKITVRSEALGISYRPYKWPLSALEMVKQAFHTYKHVTGVYPARIGLDYFTRLGEYTSQYGESYHEMVTLGITSPSGIFDSADGYPLDAMATVEHVFVKIEPAIFGEPEYYPDAPIIKSPPKEGRDEVYCERDGRFMSVVFSDSGYDAILWD